MIHPLALYHGRLALLRKEREKLDEDFAQVLAEGLRDGFSIVDLTHPPKQDFDL